MQSLYIKKDVPNKIYIREKLFTYCMNSSKSLDENLDELKRLTKEFATIGDKLGSEREATLLINSLPEAYRDMKIALNYEKDSINLESVISAIKCKELELKQKSKGNGFFLKRCYPNS